MKLTVLNVAYPLAPVGPDATGGAEQVVARLDEALVSYGHTSIVVAQQGSQVKGTLVPTSSPGGVLDDAARERAWDEHRHVLADALAHWDVDLIHMHGVDFNHYLPPPGVPVLVTLHLPPGWYPPKALRPERPLTWMNCVSESQERACPSGAPLFPYIPNGVPVERFETYVNKRDWAMALGRICPEKGFHIALDAARRAGISLLLAGEVYRYPEHERYFRSQVAPRLDHQRRFLGPIGFARKRRLLAAARCLLVPSLAPETSSLVAMEALACGTPVVAFPAGALADIVKEGTTGYLVRDEEEMVQALYKVGALDPDACRRAARERFSSQAMVRRYLEVYGQLARREELRYDAFAPA